MTAQTAHIDPHTDTNTTASNDASVASEVLDTSTMDIKAKQAAYHDYEASTYDDKFGISYDERCIDYARDRFRKVVPTGMITGKVLELGAGTGFFTVNLALGGCIEGELHCSDISEGMLDVCKRNAADHGVDVIVEQGDAEALPYDDDTFDAVIGHAFIHHLPVPGKAFQEALRVLKPGGMLIIAGEPSFWGDRIAGVVKRTSYRAFRRVTALPGLRKYRKDEVASRKQGEQAILAALEHEVDLHTFRPDEVARMADIAGFTDIQVVSEELTANWWGWAIRTIEGSARPGTFGIKWAYNAYNGYRLMTLLDEKLLEHVVPDFLFYNLVVAGRKPLDA